MKAARVPRWAVSFADLCLLLLGFFVLLQAHQARPDQLAAGLRSAFGATAATQPDASWAADSLFQPGEAVLTAAAAARFAKLGAEARAAKARVQIISEGTGGATQRFDRWELAAARAAAVARAVRAGGVAEDRVTIALPPGDDKHRAQAQRITVLSTRGE